MFRSRLAALLMFVSLAACTDSTPERVGARPKDKDLAGGSSGTEGSVAPCEEVQTPLASLDTRSEHVGASAADLLALANREPEVPLDWPALDSGPKFEHSSSVIEIEVTATDEPAIEVRCDDPNVPKKRRPKPRIELPVVLTLKTDDGVLDARIDAVLAGESHDRARIMEPGRLKPEALGGRLGRAIAAYYTDGYRDVLLALQFGPSGTTGWIGGPFSPSRTNPCAFTAYASWPANAECPFEYEPSKKSMTPYLERLNREFDLTWNSGEATKVTLDVALADGATCSYDDGVTHPVSARIVTADGRVDLTVRGELLGVPFGVAPWPEHLADYEPFTLNLNASIALNAADLSAKLKYEAPGVSAAIVNFWVSSPVGPFSSLLDGGLRVTPIGREGFDTPLPEVQLPGGDSERCFSSGAKGPVLKATFKVGPPAPPRTDVMGPAMP